MNDESAKKNDQDKVDLSLIPMISNIEHAKAFMVGEKKYGRYNYTKGHKASQLAAAAQRHLNAWFQGEEHDPKDGQHHLGSVMACCSMILRQMELGTLKDDRYAVTKNDNIRPTDIDGCLIVHTKDMIKASERVSVVDPLTGKPLYFKINKPMVRLLKEEKHRGNYILVWSRGGWEWARNVIQALDLVEYVDQIMSKPLVYLDDTPVNKWMKDRVFIDADVAYKESK